MFNQLNFGMRGHDTKAKDIETLADTLESVGATHVQLALKKSFKDIKWRAGVLTPRTGPGDVFSSGETVLILGARKDMNRFLKL